MTFLDQDLATLGALAVAMLPSLVIARKQPRLALLLLIVACLAAPLAVSIATSARSFMRLRLLAWGVFAAFPVGAVAVALLVRKRSRPYALGALLAAVVTLGIYAFAFHIEPYRLEVNHYEIVTERLEEPLRIVLLADIQTSRIENVWTQAQTPTALPRGNALKINEIFSERGRVRPPDGALSATLRGGKLQRRKRLVIELRRTSLCDDLHEMGKYDRRQKSSSIM